MNRLALALFLSFLSALVTYPQDKFPYQEYDPRTLGELVQQSTNVNEYKGTKQVMIDAKPFYSAVRVKFTGSSRPISDNKKDVFKMWQESLQADSRVLTLLDKEFLFKECDKEYWVPVQKQVAAYFPKELKAGDTITLYLMVIGGLKEKEEWDIIFLVNEYRKY